jgi:N-carbamoyl-L-amino-acid hydrolase
MRLDASWRTLLERGEDLVMTFGIFTTDPREHAMTRVPAGCASPWNTAAKASAPLDDFLELAEAEAAEIARERRVRIELGPAVRTPPAVMDPRLLSRAQALCRAGGMPFETLASAPATMRRSSPMPGCPPPWSSSATSTAATTRARRWISAISWPAPRFCRRCC